MKLIQEIYYNNTDQLLYAEGFRNYDREKREDFLKQYSKQFNGLEFNSTHYRIPTIEQVLKKK